MVHEQSIPTPLTESSPKVESFPVKSKTFTLEQLGLPADFDQRQEITVQVHPFVTKEPFKAVVEIAEYTPQTETQPDEKGVTIVITGGGGSLGASSNIKLGLELEKALQTLKDEQPDKKIPPIKTIYFVPSIVGVAREPNEHTHGKTLRNEADVVLQSLRNLPLGENTLLVGFSTGGAQSVELASKIEKTKDDDENLKQIENLDLILLETAGTVETNKLKSGWNFTLGAFVRAWKKHKRINGALRSLGKARDEIYLGWVTRRGKVQNFLHLLNESARPKTTIKEAAEEHGLSKTVRPGIEIPNRLDPFLTRSVQLQESFLTGNILQIQMTNAGVVNNPADFMINEKQFPNAKSRTAIGVYGGAHTSIMTDTQGNEPLTAAEVTTLTKTGPKTEFKRLGSGQERMNRIAGGYYSPLARLMAEWMRDTIGDANTKQQTKSKETAMAAGEQQQPPTSETLSEQEKENLSVQFRQLLLDVLETRFYAKFLEDRDRSGSKRPEPGIMEPYTNKVKDDFRIRTNTQMTKWLDRRQTYKKSFGQDTKPDQAAIASILEDIMANDSELVYRLNSNAGGANELKERGLDAQTFLESLTQTPTQDLVSMLDRQIATIHQYTEKFDEKYRNRQDPNYEQRQNFLRQMTNQRY